ncbi:MAG: FMN-binding glutamate synthase family protein [Candidatus Marinimicrobia bacterium]|nr:FMN-binding glutamate synthase family protein [Candidatus Neomarinimicrobiota bacterium]MBL7011081.1 FMN-binding glutamate synthase family protein [Candidatus Neomarinimicrobiota bacterium]MBL7031097.1 FMN-binding glutamate synthase family protein [Candidatus Neomarinimicrobiota bacterium]
MFQNIALNILLTVFIVVISVPPVLFLYVYLKDRRQSQHSILRNFPLLGRIRYIFEMMGPELRQYMFDGDTEAKPFSRADFTNIVVSGKYMKTLIAFGSKRDFNQPGWYLKNAMFPKLAEEMNVVCSPKIKTKRYVGTEGLFSRKEALEEIEIQPWSLTEEDAVIVGSNCQYPWSVRGPIGMSAMSFGALGENAISAMSLGLGKATGSWVHTGEGGLAKYHLLGGGDVIMQIGPGLFGVRTEAGDFCPDRFKEKATNPQVKMFELKLAQGAKIRGGHVEGSKVNPEIAEIRGVTPWKNVDSPNRHKQFHDTATLFDFIDLLRDLGGKPIGIKVVMGGPDSANELCNAMAETGRGPDAIIVDGGEGGSGATYQEMADTMGLPVKSGLIYMDNALRKYGVRDKVKVFASGKLFSPDKVAIAMGMGADLINIARGMMISVGCIGAEKCHTNKCPVGVATTDADHQKGLVVDEKQWRVLNYVITMRNGLNSLAAASGLSNYTQFTREHVMYKDEFGRVKSLAELFPYPNA